MDLRDSPAEAAFRAEVRAWLEENLPPSPYPEPGEAGAIAFNRAWYRRLYDAGYAGISWPREYGGAGATPQQQLVFAEELVRANAPGPFNEVGIHIAGPAIMECGTEEQKRRYLPRILSAEEIWCQGFSEPGAGSDLASLRTRAVRDGDHWVVNGQKVWSTLAHMADWCELLVRTDPDAPKHRGITCLLVDMRTPGIEVRPLRQITGRSDFNEIFLTEVRVPRQQTLGEPGQGWTVAMATLAGERAAVLSSHLHTRRRVEQLVALARERGRATDPLVRQRLGSFLAWAEILRLLSFWTATKAARAEPPGLEGPIAKLLWSGLEQRMSETAAEVLGADGMLGGPWLERLLDSRSYTIAAGTSEILRNVLAERGLGLPREPR